MVLEVNAALPVHDVDELISYAKANPGKLNFGSGGNGTLSHLSLEMLRARTGANIVHVPYKELRWRSTTCWPAISRACSIP